MAVDKPRCNQCSKGKSACKGSGGAASGGISASSQQACSSTRWAQEAEAEAAAAAAAAAARQPLETTAGAAATPETGPSEPRGSAGLLSRCDAATVAVLDKLSIDELVLLKFQTTTNTLRSAVQRSQYQALTQSALQSALDSINAMREADRAADNGLLTAKRTAVLQQERSFKLQYVLPYLVFGRQPQGTGMSSKQRLDALTSGSFAAPLIQAALTAGAVSTATSSQRLAAPDCEFDSFDRRVHKCVAAKVYERNFISKGAQRLSCEDGHAGANEETEAVLRSKNLAPGQRAGVTDTPIDQVRELAREAMASSAAGDAAQEDALHIGVVDVLKALKRASAGSAPGPDGLCYEHLWALLGSDAARVSTVDSEFDSTPKTPATVHILAQLFDTMLNEPHLLTDSCWRLWRLSNLSAIGAKRRPIACSGVLRRLLSSIIARKASSSVSVELTGLWQYGVGVSSGVEFVATLTRCWHELCGTILQLDCKNAFNSVDRKAILAGLERFGLTALIPFFTAMYLGETLPELRAELRVADGAATDGAYLIHSQLGVQQGDPLGPLLYALAQTHALHPVQSSSSSSSDVSIAPHSAYLDDLNALLQQHIDAAVVEQVRTIVARLAAIGLEINLGKSLFVAKRGHTFTPDEREHIRSLGIPFVDASAAAEHCGFVTVGVPVGCPEFVKQQLDKKLFDSGLWQLAWQLRGMAESHLLEALQILRGSLTKRFGHLVRNVDPEIGRAHFSGYDDFCMWTLESMLQVKGAASAQDMQHSLVQACAASDADCSRAALKLSVLGPDEFKSLPLEAAQLREAEGGLAMPRMCLTSCAAYVAQLQITLAYSIRTVAAVADWQTTGLGDVAASPLVTALRGAVLYLDQHSDFSEKLQAPSELLEWAKASQDNEALLLDDSAAFAAVTAAPLQLSQPAPSDDTTAADCTSTPTSVESASNSVSGEQRGMQKRLSRLLLERSSATLWQRLLQKRSASDKPRSSAELLRCAAQLRSQSGSGALAWTRPQQSAQSMSSPKAAAVLLVAMFVKPWEVSGAKCPFCPDNYSCEPSITHALCCSAQHSYGVHAVHTAMKRRTQNMLRKYGVSGAISNEDRSPFIATASVLLRMDTVMQPSSLGYCSELDWQRLGFLVDNSVRSPAGSDVRLVRHAAASDGVAAAAGEADKHTTYDAWYESCRYKLVPFVHETYGRLGREGGIFVKHVAEHAARCKGGSVESIKYRQPRLVAAFKAELSAQLAYCNAERLFAYVGGAMQQCRSVVSVSSLLTSGGVV